MKLQYCSDLHLEFPENRTYLKLFPLKPEGEILLLAGDIVLFKQRLQHDDFFKWCSDNFEATYWIPGNHEYYQSDVTIVETPLCEKIKTNVFLLNNQTVSYKNVELVLSTLWSNIPPQYEWEIQKNLNDFYQIKKHGNAFTVNDFNSLHGIDLAFLKNVILKPITLPRIFVTHHVPTFMNYPQKYRHSEINSAFATELYDLIETSNAAFWIYGHHHNNTNAFEIGKTLMLTNQLGYVKQNEHHSFNRTAIIEI